MTSHTVPLSSKPFAEQKYRAHPGTALWEVSSQGPHAEAGLSLVVFIGLVPVPTPFALALERAGAKLTGGPQVFVKCELR